LADKTVSFVTFGCKLNQYDTDFLKEAFRKKGYHIVEEGPADIVVVNTCVVTHKGAAKCRQAIRSAVRQGSNVVVTGCYPQVAQDEVAGIPGVIAVTGVRDRQDVPSLVEKALSIGDKVVKVRPHEPGEEFQETGVSSPTLTRAFLKIQEGCDDFCTYCIVPYARGPSRSRPLESILKEARGLVGKGYREIVLTGTHLGLYRPSLTEVIRKLSAIDGLMRLRLSSLEPHDVTLDLIDCLRLPQVCHHLHLPLQSGSDRILRTMGRPYTSGDFLAMVKEVRKVAPDVGLTTDIIVGFPGETREDFARTLEVATEASFSRIHVFRFSPRPRTPAASLPERVSEREKEFRSRKLISLGRELSLTFHRKHVGRTLEVVVEEKRTKQGLLTGVTRNYIRCFFPGNEEHKGKVIQVKGRKAIATGLECEIQDAT